MVPLDDGTILEFSGAPNEPQRDDEGSGWKRFLGFMGGLTMAGKLLRKGADLAKAASRSQTNRNNAQAEKFAAEAAEAAARADQARQVAVASANTELARIFTDARTPEAAKLLQLAKFLEANPGIEAQVDKINRLYEKLRVVHGTTIEFLPPGREVGTGQPERESETVE